MVRGVEFKQNNSRHRAWGLLGATGALTLLEISAWEDLRVQSIVDTRFIDCSFHRKAQNTDDWSIYEACEFLEGSPCEFYTVDYMIGDRRYMRNWGDEQIYAYLHQKWEEFHARLRSEDLEDGTLDDRASGRPEGAAPLPDGLRSRRLRRDWFGGLH